MSHSWLGRARRRGVALVSVLLVLVIIFILASAFAQMAANDVRTTQAVSDATLTMFLAEAGVEYALWVIKHNLVYYPAVDYDATGDTTADTAGTIINLGPSQKQEHIVINDLSYQDAKNYGETNWMGGNHYCGTFAVTVTKSGGTVSIQSTGRIREVPSNWTWGTDVLTPADLTSTAFNNVVAQRTLNVNLSLSTVTETTSTRLTETQWYEQFR